MNLYYINREIEDCLCNIEFYEGGETEHYRMKLKMYNERLTRLIEQRSYYYEVPEDAGTSHLG